MSILGAQGSLQDGHCFVVDKQGLKKALLLEVFGGILKVGFACHEHLL